MNVCFWRKKSIFNKVTLKLSLKSPSPPKKVYNNSQYTRHNNKTAMKHITQWDEEKEVFVCVHTYISVYYGLKMDIWMGGRTDRMLAGSVCENVNVDTYTYMCVCMCFLYNVNMYILWITAYSNQQLITALNECVKAGLCSDHRIIYVYGNRCKRLAKHR